MQDIIERYAAHADAFEALVAGTRPEQWHDPSPCADWDARGVVAHVVGMHEAMLTPVGRRLSPAPSVEENPLAAFRSARADVEALLSDPALAAQEVGTPVGAMTAAQHVDGVISEDLVIHGWDLARATGQDDRIDDRDLERMWPGAQQIPAVMRTPGAFGPGIVVYGPEVAVEEDASIQDRLLGLLGRDPHWRPSRVDSGPTSADG